MRCSTDCGGLDRSDCDSYGWSFMGSPTAHRLLGVWGSGPDDVFAVGARGTILHYDGTGWSGLPSSTARDLFTVTGSLDGRTVVAAGASGAVVVLRR